MLRAQGPVVMRIAMVATPFGLLPPMETHGLHEVIWHLIRGLGELGHEVVALAPAGCDVPCELIPICNEVISLKETGLNSPEAQEKLPRVLEAVHQGLRGILPEIDVIHTHAIDLPEFASHGVLRTLHAALPLPELLKFIPRQSGWYVTVSKNQMKTCRTSHVPGRVLGVVYNGEDPDRFPIVTEPEEYLCVVSRICPEKGIAEAIELAIALDRPIKVCGPVHYRDRDYFEAKIRPHLTHPLVEYLGELIGNEKVAIMASAKANLHLANWREAFGLSVLESAYCGTPTLAKRCGAMQELIEDMQTGLLVEDLAEAFLSFEALDGIDRRYTAQRARTLFNYRRMTEDYLAAYQKVYEQREHSKAPATVNTLRHR